MVDSPPPPPPPRSRLAIVAVVLAFLPGCPLVNAIGAVLGAVTMRRLDRFGGRRGDRRLGVVALLGGTAMTIVTAGAWSMVGHALQASDQADIAGFVESALAGDRERAEALASQWFPGTRGPRADAVLDFAAEAEARYGPLERLSITSTEPGDPPMNPMYHVAAMAVFRDERRLVGARFQRPAGSFGLRPHRIEILDADRGNLVLGE